MLKWKMYVSQSVCMYVCVGTSVRIYVHDISRPICRFGNEF